MARRRGTGFGRGFWSCPRRWWTGLYGAVAPSPGLPRGAILWLLLSVSLREVDKIK